MRCYSPVACRFTLFQCQTIQDRYLWLFGDTILGKNATAEAWVQKGGIHAFPRQSLGALLLLAV